MNQIDVFKKEIVKKQTMFSKVIETALKNE